MLAYTSIFSRAAQFGRLYRHFSTSSHLQSIEIPQRIDRTDDALLKALAWTVSKDETAGHYKFIDDPFLLPKNSKDFVDFPLAKENGRKAAKWVLKNNPQVFETMYANPAIESLDVKNLVGSEIIEVKSRQDFVDLMARGMFLKAFKFYDLEMKKGKKKRMFEFGDELKLQLLEGLCYSNCLDIKENEYYDERWLEQYFPPATRPRWESNCAAETVFKHIAEGESSEKIKEAAYSALICGSSRYFNVSKAKTLYEDMLKSGMKPSVYAFNSYIRIVPYFSDNSEARWHEISEVFDKMKQSQVKPNLDTFNSALQVLAKLNSWMPVRKIVLAMLNEMNFLKIEPSLASYAFVLQAYYNSKTYSHPSLLESILQHLEKQTDLSVKRDVRDSFFYVTAMEICSRKLMDSELAERVKRIYDTGGNSKLIGGGMYENRFYKNFLITMVESLALDEFLPIHDSIVPMRFVPDTPFHLTMLNMIAMQGEWKHLSRFWSDAIQYRNYLSSNIVSAILQIMQQLPQNDFNTHKDELLQIALNIKSSFDDMREKYAKQESVAIKPRNLPKSGVARFTGPNMGVISQVLARCEQTTSAIEVLKHFSALSDQLLGVPHSSCLSLVGQACVRNLDYEGLIELVKLCYVFDSSNVISELEMYTNQLNLSQKELQIILQALRTQDSFDL